MHALIIGLIALVQSDSLSFVVLNHGRPAGDMQIVTAGDSVVVKFQYVDRNRGPRVETHYRLTPNGDVISLDSRGLGADFLQSAQNESFAIANGFATWKTTADSGRARSSPGSMYRPRGATPYDDAALARQLIRAPGKSIALLPAGTARAELILDTAVSSGNSRQRIRLVFIDGMYDTPLAVWLDDRDRPFASGSQWFTTVRRGWESALPALRQVEYAAREQRSAAIAKRLAPAATNPVIIRNGDLFDSERGVIRPRMSVVVNGDRIVAVGPADSVPVPRGATVIDATGKTVLPGLWDMHTHLDLNEGAGLLGLAAGVTTVRDMASDIDDALSRRRRANDGTILAPREILSGFMDGQGAWAGPTSVLVSNEAQAHAAVARYDSLGYRQIKVYNLIHPDLIPVIAADAHQRGLRVSGHVARGLSVPAAVKLGYDEINHAAFLFSTFFPDSLHLPRMRSYGQVAAAVAPTFNVDGPEMTSLITLLRDKGTVVDGTFNLWMDNGRPLDDGTDFVFGPSLAWLPAPMRREYTPAPPGSPQEAAVGMATNAAYMRLAKRLFDAGVTMVAGTDNLWGLSYHGELEIYERAGIPAPSVLQIATIVAARVMKDDKDYGSISAGKIADLVIVDGKPAQHITDLRKTEMVMRAGRLYRSADLYGAAGLVRR